MASICLRKVEVLLTLQVAGWRLFQRRYEYTEKDLSGIRLPEACK
jgi:hypothetical protein